MKTLNVIAVSACFFMSLTSSCALAAGNEAGRFAYLAYGDLRGHIEPCGCDPATDLGGVKRIGAMLARERVAHPGVLVFGLGNDLPYPDELQKSPSAAVKADFILEADATNAVSAMLLNETELASRARIEAFTKAQPKLRQKLPYVLSNAKGSNLAARSVKRGDAVIFGYTYADSVKQQVQAVDAKLLESWRDEKKASGATRAVLLFSGPDAHLDRVVKAKVFDEIVSSNTKARTAEPSVDEKTDESRLVRRKDPLVRMVPLAGQGVLRGGAAQNSEAKPVADFFKKGPENSPIGGGAPMQQAEPLLFGPTNVVTWLDVKQGSTQEFDELYARYDAAVKKSFAAGNAVRIKDLQQTPFAGAEACRSCHPNAYKVWQGAKHAHAMQTLQEKNKQQDPECVACHSVGFHEKGGFVSLEASPQFANVQCENCHGAALAHTKNPAQVKPSHAQASVPETCVACHNRQHSPAFDAKSYWQRIQHDRS